MTKMTRKKRSWRPMTEMTYIAVLICFFLVVSIVIIKKISTYNTIDNAIIGNKGSSILDPIERGNFDLGDDSIRLIQEGYLHLIGLNFNHFYGSSRKNGTAPYRAIGTFCHLDFSKHKENPSAVPMFKDLMKVSPECIVTKVSVDLHTATIAAKEYDYEYAGSRIKSMLPKGFVFHESRCGSTLVANSLASFEPQKNRVYSESPPPITALQEFDSDFEEESIQLLQDTIYLMGRTNDMDEENLFFKIQSIGSKSIWAMRKAFPTTPWIYLYRDPVQVMRSHLKDKGVKRAVCLRSQRHPGSDIKELVKTVSNTDPHSLTTEQFCAAHLATLCLAAEEEVSDSNGLGRFVNYAQLPQVLIEDIIPKHFLRQSEALSQEAEENILVVNQMYSKGRNTGKIWKEDSKLKEDTAWDELIEAADEYMLPVYKRMEATRLII